MRYFKYISKLRKSALALLGASVICAFFSCKKFVEIPPPDSQLSTNLVFSNDATATASLTGIYGQMLRGTGFYGNFPSFSINGGLLSDELINYQNDALQIATYNNNLSSTLGSLSQFYWSNQYNFIYQANAVIEGLNKSTGVSSPIKQQLIGEAKFIRALCHFYLVNLFGDIPLVTTTNYQINNVSIRTPRSEVYQQIISDLLDAQSSLSSNYVSATNTTTTEKIRPNKTAATALLARVYLYIGDWANAELQSSAVINSPGYSLLSDQNKVFLKNSSEAIWQLQSVNISNINTFDATTFILTGTPTRVSVSNQLLNAFETGDTRKANWIKSITVGSNTYYYPFKYKQRTDATYSEYTMVLRIAEQYLIRAESEAQLNNIAGAQADLNTIRSRANLGNTTANDKASLLSAIEHERQVELFTEWGHRWLDLKRTNRADAVLGPVKGTNWQSTDTLFPIPQIEIQNNPKLTQNLGY